MSLHTAPLFLPFLVKQVEWAVLSLPYIGKMQASSRWNKWEVRSYKNVDICNVIAVAFFVPVEASFIVRFMALSDQSPGHKAHRTISGYVPDIAEAKVGKKKKQTKKTKQPSALERQRHLWVTQGHVLSPVRVVCLKLHHSPDSVYAANIHICKNTRKDGLEACGSLAGKGTCCTSLISKV